MFESIFKFKKVVIGKLQSYGFTECGNGYAYSAALGDTDMTLTVYVSPNGNIDTKVTDNGSSTEYTLYKFPEAEGAFVGHIRELCENILTDISKKCFETEIFKSDTVKSVIEYFKETYDSELEFLWEKFPDCAVVRRTDNKKWYAVIMTVSPASLGLKGTEKIEIIDIRCAPEDIESAVDKVKIFPGYHMNKKHWITAMLDGSVNFEKLCQLIDASYIIAGKRK